MDEITETQMHYLICAFCDNEHCCKGTDKCEFEQWKKARKTMTPDEYRQITEYLKEFKQLREQTRWIPVSERLPKAGEYIGDVAKYYLVQNEYGDMFVARYTHSEYWEQIYQIKPYSDRIVAWMELPESYVESKEVEDESSN